MNLAVGPLCCREGNLLTACAAITFVMETVGNENSEIAREVQTALELFHRGSKICHRFFSTCKAGRKAIANYFPDSVKIV
jgi:hypothetical protein